MSELPESWLGASLKDVAEIMMGQSPPSTTYNTSGIGLPFFQGKAEFGKLYPIVEKWCSEPVRVARKDDILIAVRAPVGPTNLAPSECCIGRGLSAIRGKGEIDTKYLLYFFRSIERWLGQQGTGSTFTAINRDFLEELIVPLAPLNEQKRIVAKLDELLPKVEACKERLQKIPTILKRFRQSVLAAAVSGKLTEKKEIRNYSYPDLNWVERPEWASEFSEGWKFCKLGVVLDRIEAGKNFNCLGTPVSGSAVGLVKISAVTWDEFDPGQTKTVNDPKMVNPKLFISSGDLLVTRANTRELVGASVIVRDLHHQIMISDKVWRVHLTDYNKGFLHLFLKSSFGRSQIEQMVSGNQAAMFNISQKAFSEIIVPFLPLTVQEQIYKSADLLL